MSNDNDTPDVTTEEIVSVGSIDPKDDIYIQAATRDSKGGINRRAAIWLKLQAASDFRLSKTQAMRLLYVDPSSGAVKLTSDGAATLVEAETDCKFFGLVSADKYKAVWRGVRVIGGVDVEYISEYTIERAKVEIDGIERKSNWRNPIMLVHRAKMEVAKVLWPHIVSGNNLVE